MKSIGADLLVHLLCLLGGGYDHLAEDGFLLLELGDLVLEVGVFLFLVNHAQLQAPVQGLHQWSGGVQYFVIAIANLIPHGVQVLTEKLDQLVVLLEVLVGLPDQVLDKGRGTSTMLVWPTALVVLALRAPSFRLLSRYDMVSYILWINIYV